MGMVVSVYGLSQSFPPDERFGLTTQVRRSAGSVPANIAEGFGRQTRPAFANFLRVARGSLLETETHIELAIRLNFISADAARDTLAQCDRVGRMLHGLMKSLSEHPAPSTEHP